MNFGLEKCARICLIKRGSVQSKMHIGSTFENDINLLAPELVFFNFSTFCI